MGRTEKYYCDLCGMGFNTKKECIEHETKHYANWGETDNNKIAEELHNLSESVLDHVHNGTVFGYFVSDFRYLIAEAAKRLGEENK